MLHIGLTGGIGCGKTTVLAEFERLGVPCFVADRHAADYYHNPDFLNAIRKLFGDSIIGADGNADKKAIAQIVFNDSDKLHQLNALVHPMVMDDFRQWASAFNGKVPYVIIESAIIFEYQLERQLDAVVAVYLEREERVRRLLLRDRVDRQAIEDRMRNQLPAEEKMDRADYVILNYEGNPRRRQVEHINRIITL